MSLKRLKLNNILPEMITLASVISLTTVSFGFRDICLWLGLASLLRLIWNSAILVHGMGHLLAIAAVDRCWSKLKLLDALEHRSIGEILESLLPFAPIFLPLQSKLLWIEAGEPSAWRIRIKAIGGIGANVAAIAFAFPWWIHSQNAWWGGDYSAASSLHLFLGQTVIVANLILAIASGSDIQAAITGVAQRFYCGNFGFLAEPNTQQDEPEQLLPERMANLYYLMARETEIRGEQAGGGLVTGKDRYGNLVFVGKKIVNRKRDNLTASLEKAFAGTRRRAIARGTKPLESNLMGVWHYRFATSGPPAVEETHWHEWMSARIEDVWQYADGEWRAGSQNVNHRITHNGDFDQWTVYDRPVENVELGWWLARVLHTPNHTVGDSAKIAGLMDLLITKGIWSASVRLAYQLAIASGIESAFDGQSPSADGPNTAPTPADLTSWANIFTENFIGYRQLLGAPDSPSCHQYLCRLENDILQALGKQEQIAQWTWQRRLAFVRTTIHAFFNNDPYFATKTFMSKAIGSFGLVTVSTLDAQRLVLSAKGQPISIGFNWPEKYMVYASEPAAVDSVLLNLPQAYRLDLDQKQGEIALVSTKEITIYSIGKGRELSSIELKNKWISMAEHPYLPHVKYPSNNTEDPIASDCQEIPAVLEEIRLAWQNPASLPCQTADYLAELFCEKARTFEAKREQMLRAGMTGQLTQLPTVDLLITGVENSLWLGERFASDLKIIFPWLNIEVISSNQVLQQLGQDFSSLKLGQDSLVLAITQSGQTFPTVHTINTFDQLRRQGIIDELFILTGELGSFLGSPVIQPKQPSTDERHNVFVNGSGRRTAEPSTVAVAAAQQTLTELLLYIAQRLRQTFPDSNPLGMTITAESLTILTKMKDDFLDLNVVQIVATTPTGKPIDTSIKQQLKTMGRKWAWHILETPVAWAIQAVYVLITVGWAIPFGYTIPLVRTLWRALVWATQLPLDSLVVRVLDPLVTLSDIAIYIFGSWLWTLLLRYFQGRQVLARVGKRSLVIGDMKWVNKLLQSYVSKLFSLSYGIASLEVHSGDPEDDLLHDYGHRVVRGTLLFLGVPDGRRSPKLKQKAHAVIMTGKQADGVRNINVGPEVLLMGSDPEISHKGFSNTIVLESNDEYFYFKDDSSYFSDQNSQQQKALVEELRESRFSSFERLLASYIFFWALAQRVASFPLLRYQHWKSQSRTKIMTTAAPVAGTNLPDLEERQSTAESEVFSSNEIL